MQPLMGIAARQEQSDAGLYPPAACTIHLSGTLMKAQKATCRSGKKGSPSRANLLFSAVTARQTVRKTCIPV